MRGLLWALAERYEYIVIDSPPLLATTDALSLAHIADGAIVVARYRATRRNQLKDTIDSLENVNARVLGIVLNQVKERGDPAYYGTAAAPEPAAAVSSPAAAVPRSAPAAPETDVVRSHGTPTEPAPGRPATTPNKAPVR
jgi:hypothetical protein